jgi:hypothetical protein
LQHLPPAQRPLLANCTGGRSTSHAFTIQTAGRDVVSAMSIVPLGSPSGQLSAGANELGVSPSTPRSQVARYQTKALIRSLYKKNALINLPLATSMAVWFVVLFRGSRGVATEK